MNTLGDWLSLIGLVLALPSAALSIVDIRARTQGDVSPTGPRAAPRQDPEPIRLDPPAEPPSANSLDFNSAPLPPALPRPPQDSSGAINFDGTEPLGLGRRLLSQIIDLYAAVVLGVLPVVGQPSDQVSGFRTFTQFALMGVGVFLYVFLTATSGRSIGRFLVGGRVVRVNARDAEIGFSLATKRLIIAVATSFFFFSVWSGLANPERRTFHDRKTDTRVVRSRR